MEASVRRPENIYYTSDYSIFKKLKGNRDVDPKRVKKVIKSIQTYGLIYDPVRVSPQMEVGEGQATLKAYEALGLEVPYFIDPNMNAERARVLNSSRTSWTEADYIKSFASTGKEAYKFLHRMISEHPSIPISTIEGIARNTNNSGGTYSGIRDGKFDMSVEDMIRAENKIRFLSRFSGVLNTKKGRKNYWYHAIGFCYDQPTVLNERLIEKFQTYSADVFPAVDVEDAITQLQNIYNKGAKNGKVYIRHLYEVAKEKK